MADVGRLLEELAVAPLWSAPADQHEPTELTNPATEITLGQAVPDEPPDGLLTFVITGIVLDNPRVSPTPVSYTHLRAQRDS